MKFKRVFLIVLDSLGIGNGKDAARFGDSGADTFGHIAEKMEDFSIPHLQKMGVGNLKKLKGVDAVSEPSGKFFRLNEASNGKDTMTGHWEMMGIKTEVPFVTFTDTGFPKELIQELEERTGHKVIGNKSASGTAILDELGEEQIRSGAMIVYTSADSVLQIAAPEDEKIFGLKELYRCCEIARDICMKPAWKVGRVIARPYVGTKKGEFKRTANRHDLAIKPPQDTVLNALQDAGYTVISIGKIADIFVNEGITEAEHSNSSVHGMEQCIELAKNKDFTGLCFVNLVDFDAVYGHRRNPVGYGEEIERFDRKLGELLSALREGDLLLLTADHGNDPTYTGTDHTREQVPLLAYYKGMHGGEGEEQDSFSVIGASIAENFSVAMPKGLIGKSILSEIEKE